VTRSRPRSPGWARSASASGHRDEQLTAAIVGSGNIAIDLLIKPLCSIAPWLASARPPRARPGLVSWACTPPPTGWTGRRVASSPISSSRPPRRRRIWPTSHGTPRPASRPSVLTPAAIGPFVCPRVNLDGLSDAPNLNMIRCGGRSRPAGTGTI
jgi:acetaldehyde dehydrogenase